MPTSHSGQINEIVELIVNANPASVLDIGVGFGKYGFLSREYLELSDGRNEYNNWTRRIDGIEGYADYIGDLQKLIYSNVYIGNVLEILPKSEIKYDLILLIDVFEHFTYEEGMKLLGYCQKHGKNIIISTPKLVSEQGGVFNNPLESHKFQWEKKHFDGLKEKFYMKNLYSHIYFIGPDADAVKKKIQVSRYKLWVIVNFPVVLTMYKWVKKK
jgi:hypothetical protein